MAPKVLNVTLRMWSRPRYVSGRGRSRKVFPNLPEARNHAAKRGYTGIRLNCK